MINLDRKTSFDEKFRLENNMHNRFTRKVWLSREDFTGALAKWLVKQSPYVVPENLEVCIKKFHNRLDINIADFDKDGFAEINLSTLTEQINHLLESIPEIMELNVSKTNRSKDIVFITRYSKPLPPDEDFIDIMAIAQNITCEFATEADSQCWLDSKKAV